MRGGRGGGGSAATLAGGGRSAPASGSAGGVAVNRDWSADVSPLGVLILLGVGLGVVLLGYWALWGWPGNASAQEGQAPCHDIRLNAKGAAGASLVVSHPV